jgi:nicotinate-nucleotide pyrophosphorylase (carboxylating)
MTVDGIIAEALKEDIGSGDITVGALVRADLNGTARIVAKEEGILAGVRVAERTFELVDPDLQVEMTVCDGTRLAKGDTILTARGNARSLLVAERTALNFLQRLSGTATHTARFVKAVEGTGAAILDTRKTTPGMRLLEKEAVLAGGGENHRIGLYDMVLIKDNHLSLLGCGNEAEAVGKGVAQARAAVPEGTLIEVEVTAVEGALAAAGAASDMILLDNMSVGEMAETVARVRARFGAGRPLLEASGGVTLDTVRAIAETGVDRISIGALTHSVIALDIAMYVSFD